MQRFTLTLMTLMLVATACGGDSAEEPAAADTTVTTTSVTATTTTQPPTSTTGPPETTTTAVPETTTTSSTTTTTAAPHPGVVGEIRLGNLPCALEVAGDGTAWVTMIGSNELVQIDPVTGEGLQTTSTGPGACGVAVAGGFIWVADTVSNSVFWLDAESLAFQDRLSLDGPPWDLQTDGELVWVVVRSGRVLAIDPAAAEVVMDIEPGLGQMAGLALTEGFAWAAADLGNTVLRIDASAGETTEIAVDGTPSWFGEAEGAVWVSQSSAGTVSMIDAATAEVVLTVETGLEPLDLTVAFGSVWVPNRGSGSVTRIDEVTGEVLDEINLKSGIFVVEAVGEEIWVTDFSGTAIFRIDPEAVGVG